MEPNPGREDDGIPAADPGAGAPAPADGIGGEQPDRPEDAGAPQVAAQGTGAQQAGAQDGAQPVGEAGDPLFRTPDPGEVGRG